MKLNSQASYIYNILQDRQWHCPTSWNYADGHCKRITDINRYVREFGLKVDSKVCDCGKHTSKILKRRLVEDTTLIPTSRNEVAAKFLSDFTPKPLERPVNVLF